MQTTAQTNSGHVAGSKTEADTSAHTATPWEVSRPNFTAHADSHIGVRDVAGGWVVCEVQTDIPELPGVANAEFIVRACNAHSDLVKALEGVIRVADRATDEFDAARAALRKAGANN